MTKLNILIGKTLSDVQNTGDEVLFRTTCGGVYRLYHQQDCCESVRVEDVEGDLLSLIGSPLLVAEEVSSENHSSSESEYGESSTWTFYRFATRCGYVTIRWLGESNG